METYMKTVDLHTPLRMGAKKGNLSQTYNAALCVIHAGLETRTLCEKSENIQDLCECIHKGPRGDFFMAPPPRATEAPQRSAGPLR